LALQNYRFLFQGKGEHDDLLAPGIDEYWDETFSKPLILPDGLDKSTTSLK